MFLSVIFAWNKKEYKNTRDFGFMDAIINEMEESANQRQEEFEVLSIEIQELEQAALEQAALDAEEELEFLELEESPRFNPLRRPSARATLGMEARCKWDIE